MSTWQVSQAAIDASTSMVVAPDTSNKTPTSTIQKVKFDSPFPSLTPISGCRKFLEEFNLPDAYEVPGSNVPGSQAESHTVNSVNNSDHSGDGPGSLDYDMDGSLMGYHPLKVSTVAYIILIP